MLIYTKKIIYAKLKKNNKKTKQNDEENVNSILFIAVYKFHE